VAHADAALKGVLEAAVVESYVDLLAPNLKVKCVAYLTHFTSARRVTPVAHGTSGQCADLMVPVPSRGRRCWRAWAATTGPCRRGSSVVCFATSPSTGEASATVKTPSRVRLIRPQC
jgi:hypothetical protein